MWSTYIVGPTTTQHTLLYKFSEMFRSVYADSFVWHSLQFWGAALHEEM